MSTPLVALEGFPLQGGGTLSLAVGPGEVVLLRGPNGCGKTSLLRRLAGLDSPYARAATVVRPASSRQLVTQDCRDGLVGLTVAGEFRLRRLAVPWQAEPWQEREVATLSSGEARQTALAINSAAHPDLLLLDEPAEGLDDQAVEKLLATIRDTALRGGAVVMADHSGALDPAATRMVQLGAQTTQAPHALPAPAPGTVLQAEAATVARGNRRIGLAPMSLGAGLHALMGPNGCGKSTLLLRLAGLLPHDGVRIHGQAARPGQNARLLLPAVRHLFLHTTVRAELGAIHGPAQDLVPEPLLDRHPLTLSGGEAQRVALAKTLGHAAPLYLLDEPDAHLDVQAWPVLRDALAHRIAEGACILAATHDPRMQALAHTTVRMEAP